LSNDVEYTFSFVTVDNAGNESNPVTVTAKIDRTPPGIIQITSVASSDHTITINWNDPSDTDLNHINITWLPNGTTIQPVNNGVKTFTATGLLNDTNYTFSFISVDNSGNVSQPITVTAKIDKTPPAVIQITSVATSDNKITFNWNDPIDSDFNHINITWIPNGSTVKTVNKGIKTFAATGLNNDTDYTFSFTSVDNAGNESLPITVTSKIDKTPPSLIQITAVTADPVSNKITINWTDPPESDFNHVNVTWIPNGTTVIPVNKGAGTFTATGLNQNTDYTFSFKSVDDAGNVSLPTTVTAKIDTIPPDFVKSVSTVTADQKITVNWIDPADSDLDHIILTWSPGGSVEHNINKGGQTFIATGLSNIVNYTFTLIAVDKAGNRSTAVTVTDRVDKTPPAQITLTGLTEGNGQIIFTWNDPSDADFDHVGITWLPGGTAIQSVAKGTQAYTATGLVNGTECTFSIVSVDAAGNKSAAQRLARTGIRELKQLEREFNALWPLRNKAAPEHCSAFLKWRMDDYRRALNGRAD